ncbi:MULTISPECIES: hypothetical protein [Streptomyces]|uniref:hypothetical protein n=1 Tax=Streptomyces TaxID=1883 RepID=UPI00073DBF22|nr:hypothetical protein [Streptomyces sp. EAS-AB2608]BCM66471.1 hypothetical protein EASAB2608_01805 [Streptomyces sp. EAS-AB2608]CUW28056.1 hypothetical protein TUE45_02786 [Streptomyces reticuli]
MKAATLAEQAPALACLVSLAVGHPDLPGAYITTSQFTPNELSVQLDDPSGVEEWRKALSVSADQVFRDWIGERPSVQFRTVAFRVTFHVYATYDLAATSDGSEVV